MIHWSYKWLWLGAIAFHYAFLVIVLRHLRFFTEPVPGFIQLIDSVDGFLQFFTPVFYLSGAVLVVAVAYLLARRLTNPMLRYISLAVRLLSPAVAPGHRHLRDPHALRL